MARPEQASRWGPGLVPQAPRSSGHTASAPGLSPNTDLWDRGITIKPAVRTTQMVAEDDSRTHANIFIHTHKDPMYLFCAGIHWNPNNNIGVFNVKYYPFLKITLGKLHMPMPSASGRD